MDKSVPLLLDRKELQMKFTPKTGQIYTGDKYLTFLNHAFVFQKDVEFEYRWSDGVQSTILLKNGELSIGFPLPNGDERVYHFGKVNGSDSLNDEHQFFNILPRIRGWWETDWNDIVSGKYEYNFAHKFEANDNTSWKQTPGNDGEVRQEEW